jgi:hypothetical protein
MKNKIVDLEKYLDLLKVRLSSPVPPKHLKREKSFKDFLKREIDIASKTIEKLRLSSPADKK